MKAADEAIVLAGGLGTRLRTVVDGVPKPLAPVAGRPFLAWLLDRLAANGMRRCILATGYLADVIEMRVGSRWSGMDIVYSAEPEPLGTGGAIRLASRKLLGDGVHVLNGDTWLEYAPTGLQRAAIDMQAPMSMALARVDDVQRYGAVEVSNGRVVGFLEKGRAGGGWINAGCYFLRPDALVGWPDAVAFSFESEILQPKVEAKDVVAFEETSGFIDIGVPNDYARAQSIFNSRI